MLHGPQPSVAAAGSGVQRPDRAFLIPKKPKPGRMSRASTQFMARSIGAPQVGQVTFLNALVTLSLTGSAVSVATF